MKDSIFIDTNIFVYSFLDNIKNKKEHAKHLMAKKFLQKISNNINVVISTQVCSEYYSALLKNRVSDSEIQAGLNELMNIVEVSSISKSTIFTLIDLKNRYKYSYWDSLILSSALENGCNILYSEDMQDGQIIENQLKILNPFI